MLRRELLSMAAAAAVPALDRVAARRVGNVETVFKSPGPKPNGLQATKDGLWIMDQGDNHAYLVSYQDGRVLRKLPTDADKASGITYDGQAIWLASTYSREIIKSDAMTGKTISKYFTPGAGVIYQMVGDAPGRSSPLAKKGAIAAPAKSKQRATGRPAPGHPAPGTGAHGMERRDGKLWAAVPPSREIYRLNPATWVVEKKFATAGNRPHGIGWEGKYLWCTDSNLNAFFKHDPETGEILEKIQLTDRDPLPHGMTIWEGMLWYCDDMGVVCRLKI
ncbi:MAG: hypothetical protein ABIZ80_09050 [Bryobacteraceae bacterium]